MLGNSFPLNFRQVKHAALLSKHGDSIIWHKKMGRFNVNALVYVQKHNMLLKWKNGGVQCWRS
ncbi:hypothetical protein ACOSP7_021203 [Xanthoceras sorbifolium]